MTTIHIGENIAFLRKQKGITQEELAQAMGVTNQAVSKWESCAACPDIGLLPELAAYYGVSIDELLGYRPMTTVADAALRIKAVFEAAPPEESFDLAYRLCQLLHEGAISRGYRGFLPWKPKDRTEEDLQVWASQWGYSACSEPQGDSILKKGVAFFSSTAYMPPVSARDIRRLHQEMAPFTALENLQTLYALHALTVGDFQAHATLAEIAERAGLSTEQVRQALHELPVETAVTPQQEPSYRLEGGNGMIPAILTLLLPPH